MITHANDAAKKIVDAYRSRAHIPEDKKEAIKGEFILALIARPYPVLACKDLNNMVSYRSLTNWKEKDKEFSDIWDEVVLTRELERSEEIREITHEVLMGRSEVKIPPYLISLAIFHLKAKCGYIDNYGVRAGQKETMPVTIVCDWKPKEQGKT